LTFTVPVEVQRTGLPSRPFSTVQQVELSSLTVPKAYCFWQEGTAGTIGVTAGAGAAGAGVVAAGICGWTGASGATVVPGAWTATRSVLVEVSGGWATVVASTLMPATVLARPAGGDSVSVAVAGLPVVWVSVAQYGRPAGESVTLLGLVDVSSAVKVMVLVSPGATV
jgi:hypothetical protein